MTSSSHIVEKWLCLVGLDHLSSLFLDNGYDDLETVKKIGSEDLLFLSRDEERLRLREAVRELREQGGAWVYIESRENNYEVMGKTSSESSGVGSWKSSGASSLEGKYSRSSSTVQRFTVKADVTPVSTPKLSKRYDECRDNKRLQQKGSIEVLQEIQFETERNVVDDFENFPQLEWSLYQQVKTLLGCKKQKQILQKDFEETGFKSDQPTRMKSSVNLSIPCLREKTLVTDTGGFLRVDRGLREQCEAGVSDLVLNSQTSEGGRVIINPLESQPDRPGRRGQQMLDLEAGDVRTFSSNMGGNRSRWTRNFIGVSGRQCQKLGTPLVHHKHYL